MHSGGWLEAARTMQRRSAASSFAPAKLNNILPEAA